MTTYMNIIFKHLQRIFTLLLFCSVINGCGGSKWYHPSKSTQQFYADKAECSAMGGRGSNNQIMPTYGTSPGFSTGFSQGFNQGAAIGAAMAQSQIFDDCMMGRGWSLSTASKPIETTPTQQALAPPTPTLTDNKVSTSDAASIGALTSFMRDGGFDWYAKQADGNLMYFSSKTMKKDNGLVHVVGATVFNVPKPLLCNGSQYIPAYVVCKYQIDKSALSSRALGCNLYSKEGLLCEERDIRASNYSYTPDSAVGLWMKAYGL